MLSLLLTIQECCVSCINFLHAILVEVIRNYIKGKAHVCFLFLQVIQDCIQPKSHLTKRLNCQLLDIKIYFGA
jgi:hypothetical protein